MPSVRPRRHIINSRFADLDYLGHVTTTSYLAYYEEARTQWLSEAWSTHLPAYVVARQELVYLKELLLTDSPIEIRLALTRLGNGSLDVEESLVTSAGECKNRSRATLVMWDRDLRKARPFTHTERSRLQSALAEPDDDWPRMRH